MLRLATLVGVMKKRKTLWERSELALCLTQEQKKMACRRSGRPRQHPSPSRHHIGPDQIYPSTAKLFKILPMGTHFNCSDPPYEMLEHA